MAQSSRILISHNLKRCVCTTTVNLVNYGPKFMKKLIKRDTSKRIWYTNKNVATPSPVSTEKLTSSHVTRRTTVLNKLFMTYITDLMATGRSSTKLLGRGIEISYVRVTPDFQTVLVFWSSKNDNRQVETEKILDECAFGLRHELTQLRVIGQVPMVKFVKDKQLAALAELEKRFKMADYGDDHEPVEPPFVLKNEYTINMNLLPEVRDKILQLQDEEVQEENETDGENSEDESEFKVDCPPMRHDVLGLDHYAIMTRVRQSLKKSHEASQNRLSNVLTILPTESIAPTIDLSTFNAAKNESKAFTDFLINRQIKERRQLRREKRESILAYNLVMEHYETNSNDDEDLPIVEQDVDIFEDINLEQIK